MSTANPTTTTRAWSMIGAVFVVGGTLALTGCSSEQSSVTWRPNGTPHHNHPNENWWNYQFVYYPAMEVYFEPHSGLYSWYDGTSWQDGETLPDHVVVNREHPYVVYAKSERPYYQHSTIAHAFRPGEAPTKGADALVWNEDDSTRFASHPGHPDQ